jgi:hypothetical protein
MSGTNPLLRCFVPEIRSSALKGTSDPVHLVLKSGKVPDDIIIMMVTASCLNENPVQALLGFRGSESEQ